MVSFFSQETSPPSQSSVSRGLIGCPQCQPNHRLRVSFPKVLLGYAQFYAYSHPIKIKSIFLYYPIRVSCACQQILIYGWIPSNENKINTNLCFQAVDSTSKLGKSLVQNLMKSKFAGVKSFHFGYFKGYRTAWDNESVFFLLD